MIAKKNKFPMREEFLRFRARADRAGGSYFTVYSQIKDRTRVGVVVPVKVNKRASVRNWIKRLTYDCVWQSLREKDRDCVVVYKPIAIRKSNEMKNKLQLDLAAAIKNQNV